MLNFLIFFLISGAFSKELRDEFKTYIYQTNSFKPEEEDIVITGKKIGVYFPQLDQELLDKKPESDILIQMKKSLGEFFRKDATNAIAHFNNVAGEIKKCIEAKIWPLRNECLKQIDMCFDTPSDSLICNWVQHEKINQCAPQHLKGKGLVSCLRDDQEAFNTFGQCFNAEAKLSVMFSVHGRNANRRKYYSISSYYDGPEQGVMSCRFTFINGRYHLTELSDYPMGRPNFIPVPLDVFVKDNETYLLRHQSEFDMKKKSNGSNKK